MFILESLRLNKATLSLFTTWAGKLFQTLILRQTKEFRRQFMLACSLIILKLRPLVRDVSQSMILTSRLIKSAEFITRIKQKAKKKENKTKNR